MDADDSGAVDLAEVETFVANMVALSGLAAFWHSRTSNVTVRGVTGGGALVAGLAAFVLGVMLVV